MAAAPSKQSKFWAASGKSWTHDSLVPGVNDVGNQRPKVKAKVNGGKTKEVKAKIPVNQPVVVETTDSFGIMTMSPSGQVSTDISTLGTDISSLQSRGVTLKDLCGEDKKRIANLIKELAKVGEEKENAQQNLDQERQHYQHQIMTLVQQQEAILQEREDVQNRLVEYQTYIVNLKKKQQLQQLIQHQREGGGGGGNRQPQPPPPHQPHRHHQQQHHHPNRPSNSNRNDNNVNNLVTKPPSLEEEEDDEGKRKRKKKEKRAVEMYPSRQEDLEKDRGSYYEDRDSTLQDPSTHLYINQSNTSTPVTTPTHTPASASAVFQSEDAYFEGLSTHVMPSQTPPPQSSRPLPHRPFTAMIDRQLNKERMRVEEVETGNMNDKNRKAGFNENDENEDDDYNADDKNKNNDNNNYTNNNNKNVRQGKDSKLIVRASGERTRDIHSHGSNAATTTKDGKYTSSSSSSKNHDTLKPGAPVSPEKAEIFSRFMDGGVAKQDPYGEYQEDGKKVEIGEQEGMEELEMRRRRKKESRKNDKYSSRRAPPTAARFGVFHPPVMSSTQKSSEIGDFMSNIDSTIVSETRDNNNDKKHYMSNNNDHKIVKNVNVARDKRYDYDDDSDLEMNHRKMGKENVDDDDDDPRGEFNRDVNRKARSGGSGETGGRGKNNASHGDRWRNSGNIDGMKDVVMRRNKGEKQRFDLEDNADEMGVDQDFMCYYKKLSAAERKNELLKQRATLLEEQNKLRQLLTKQSHQKSKVKEVEGRTLLGTDGDACVTYSDVDSRHDGKWNGGDGGEVMNGVVRKLDYSMMSNTNTEENCEELQQKSNLDKKFRVSPNDEDKYGLPGNSTPVPNEKSRSHAKMATSSHLVFVDAGTSMSFATIPSPGMMDGEEGAAVTNSTKEEKTFKGSKQRKRTDKHAKKPCHSESPGDKTLAVLKIINSLPDDDDDDDNDDDRIKAASKGQPHHHQHPSRVANSNSKNKPYKVTTDRVSRRHDHFELNNRKDRPDTKRSLFSKGKRDDEFETGRIDNNRQTGKKTAGVNSSGRGVNAVHEGFGKRQEFSDLLKKDMNKNRDRELFWGGGKSNVLVPGSKSKVDSELDVFDCVANLKEERLNGFRKIISSRDDDDDEDDVGDDDETYYDYNDGDDSNIDGIVDELMLSSGVEDILLNEDDDNIDDDIGIFIGNGKHLNEKADDDDDNDDDDETWNSVIKSLNRIPKVKKVTKERKLLNNDEFSDDADIDEYDDDDNDGNDNIDSSSDTIDNGDDNDDDDCDNFNTRKYKNKVNERAKRKDTADKSDGELEESAILEDVFFVSH